MCRYYRSYFLQEYFLQLLHVHITGTAVDMLALSTELILFIHDCDIPLIITSAHANNIHISILYTSKTIFSWN